MIGLRLLPVKGEPAAQSPGRASIVDVVLADGKRRPFSIANGPQADGTIELHVRHVAGGGFTAWVDDTSGGG